MDITKLKFDKKTRIVIISDLHLGKNVSEEILTKLKKIMNFCDILFVLGDLFDQNFINPYKVIQSKSKHVLELFNSKTTYLCFGNHDPKFFYSEILNKYKNIHLGEVFKIQIEDKKYYFLHGHQFDKSSKLVVNLPTILKFINGWLWYIWYKYLLKLKIFIYISSKIYKNNDWVKQRLRNIFRDGFVIHGDTHTYELDINSLYANTGMFWENINEGFTLVNNEILKLELNEPKLI